MTLNQWYIAVTQPLPTGPAGQVTFRVTNVGTTTHEFVVLKTDTPAAKFKITSFEKEKFRFDEDTAGENVGETGDMKPGTTTSLVTKLAPGHYSFVCNLPQHYGLGMHTDFTL